MKKSIIIGGSSGLGLEISKIFELSNQYEPIILSRNKPKLNHLNKNSIHEYCDLLTFSTNDYIDLFNKYNSISSICFSQRFRKKDNYKQIEDFHLDEYRVMVLSIKRALEAFKIYRTKITNKENNFFTRILIIGSTYVESVGLDQDWSYHVCKSGQLALIKYFSLQSNLNYNINMLSPATFIKPGSEKYWANNQKSDLWNKYPIKGLAKANEIAMEAFNIMTSSSKFTNGNNIHIDSGISHLYNDQSYD